MRNRSGIKNDERNHYLNVIYGHWFNRVCWCELKYSREEIQLSVQRSLDILRLFESMTLAWTQ